MKKEIAVYWLDENLQPQVTFLDKNELTAALEAAKERRDTGHHHVVISTNFGDSVGKQGVTVVGPDYDWKKRRQ